MNRDDFGFMVVSANLYRNPFPQPCRPAFSRVPATCANDCKLDTVTNKKGSHVRHAVANKLVDRSCANPPAPVAVVCRRTLEIFQDGSLAAPDVPQVMFNLDGTPLDLRAHARKYHGANVATVLRQFEPRLTAILKAAHLTVLPREELNKPVPWLQPGSEAFWAATNR
jgi:hypothetical protein